MVKVLTHLAVVVAVVAGIFGFYEQSPTVVYYRISTSLQAVYALFTVPQEHIDAFLKSYEIFDQEIVTGESKDAASIVNYYQVLNHLCAVGEVEKMYIPPVMDLKQSIFANQMIWEEKGMADKLEVGAGKRVLDVGCGRGRIAHHVARYTGAKVTGINIDPGQIRTGRDYAAATGLLGSQLEFVQGNYNEPLPFDNETFDALYHVQALTYAQDLGSLFREMHRVLRPGAKISFLDWFKLPNFNPDDKYHQKLLRDTKAVIGAVYTPTPEEYIEVLEKNGFKVLFSGEASEDGGHQWPLVMKADAFYVTAKQIVDFLTKYRIIPQHFKILLERLTEGGKSFVEADKLRLFTTSWQIIAQRQ